MKKLISGLLFSLAVSIQIINCMEGQGLGASQGWQLLDTPPASKPLTLFNDATGDLTGFTELPTAENEDEGLLAHILAQQEPTEEQKVFEQLEQPVNLRDILSKKWYEDKKIQTAALIGTAFTISVGVISVGGYYLLKK